ncbi:hypothetical protein [Zoogloea sp. LCSB751]|uniref:hypothetical protein n=1 Tax=Zoogloea sp. LCSB751 TaxID=1965277 RepID=UPI0009A48CAF|nr:hypothetical protein [Zoogloea sp. LCSB751]
MSTTAHTIEAFSWLSNDARHIPGATHAEHTHDTAKGIALILQMVEAADLAADDNGPMLMSADDRGALIRLAIASAKMLQAEAWKHIGWLNTHGVAQAKAVA